MPRNVEIKARLVDRERAVAKAKELSETEGTLLEQEDTFFSVAHGRLKLRVLPGSPGQLIFYERDDVAGPKLSNYTVATAESPCELRTVLTQALGVVGVVKKRRLLFMVGQTRVHIDSVEGLGEFIELEVALDEDQVITEGQLVADKLMTMLGIDKDHLITGAYMDLILKQATHT